MHMPYMDLVELIRGAGRRPVERDSLSQPVRETFDDPPPPPETSTWDTSLSAAGSSAPLRRCRGRPSNPRTCRRPGQADPGRAPGPVLAIARSPGVA